MKLKKHARCVEVADVNERQKMAEIDCIGRGCVSSVEEVHNSRSGWGATEGKWDKRCLDENDRTSSVQGRVNDSLKFGRVCDDGKRKAKSGCRQYGPAW